MMIKVTYNPLNKIRIKSPYRNTYIHMKSKLFFIVQKQLVNIEEMVNMKSHCLATVIEIIVLGKGHLGGSVG